MREARGSSAAFWWLAAALLSLPAFLSPLYNPDLFWHLSAARRIVERIIQARDAGDSVGGIVECRIRGVPPGLGEPVFDKLDADLAKALVVEFAGDSEMIDDTLRRSRQVNEALKKAPGLGLLERQDGGPAQTGIRDLLNLLANTK